MGAHGTASTGVHGSLLWPCPGISRRLHSECQSQCTVVLLQYLPLRFKKKKISSVKIAIFTVQLRKKCLYSIDCRDNCVAGLDFSKWNLSFSHGCLGDCSFLWQSFCDVRNHMLYTKLNLKCEWIVCKRGSVEVLWAITNLSCNAGFKFHYLLDSTFLIFGSYFVIWLVQ